MQSLTDHMQCQHIHFYAYVGRFFASFLPPDLSLTLPPKPSMYSHPFFSPYNHLALCLAPGFTSIKRAFPYSFLQSELVLRIESILSHQAVSFILFLSPWCSNNTSVIHLHFAPPSSSTRMSLVWLKGRVDSSHAPRWWTLIWVVLKQCYLLRHANFRPFGYTKKCFTG